MNEKIRKYNMNEKIRKYNMNEKIMKFENTIDTIIGKMYDMCAMPDDKDLIEEIDKLSDQEELVLNLLREKFGLKTSK